MKRVRSNRAVCLGVVMACLCGGCPTESPNADDQSARTAACDTSESFAKMVPSTFAVVIQRELPAELVGVDSPDQFIGTAFAVDPWLLATNAHVAQGILETYQLPARRVVAVQAGTGEVFELAFAIWHPEYNGDPFRSPDVGLLQLKRPVDEWLEVADDGQFDSIELGGELALTGFPGDVADVFSIEVGVTVPQATALTGTISALRNFSTQTVVFPSNIDILQHQLPTTPGTSGSPMVQCGRVVAVNNAGTVKLVVTVDDSNNLVIDRQAQASNNFGIHAKHLRDMIDWSYAGTLNDTSAYLPPPPPSYAGSYSGQAFDINDEPSHTISLSVSALNTVSGSSQWLDRTLELHGSIDQFGRINMRDNGDEFGLVPWRYQGFILATTHGGVGIIWDDTDSPRGTWQATLE